MTARRAAFFIGMPHPEGHSLDRVSFSGNTTGHIRRSGLRGPVALIAVQDPIPVAWRGLFGFSHDSAQFSPPLKHKILQAMEFHPSLCGGGYLVPFGFMQ